MLNRSAVVIGHTSDFEAWLATAGVLPERLEATEATGVRSMFLIPACHDPEEIAEVVEDLFEEFFRRELRTWLPDDRLWPDTGDFELFSRWFTVEGFPMVEDVGRGPIAEEGDDW